MTKYFYKIVAVVSLLAFLALETYYQQHLAMSLTDDKYLNKDPKAIWSCTLYRFGGRVLPPIRYKYQFYRFLLSLILHKNSYHLLSNIFLMLFLVNKVQNFLGKNATLAIFVASGITSNIFSSIYSPHTITVGLSPAIFGILGLFFLQLFLLFKKAKKIYWNFVLLAGMGLITFTLGLTGDADFLCHIFGFGLGLLHSMIEYNCGQKKMRIFIHFLLQISCLAFSTYMIFLRYGGKDEELSSIVDMGCNY